MEEPKTKKRTRRQTAGNSPAPSGPIQRSMTSACGHSGCDTGCKVRYVGPTSAMRDQQIIHAARGVANVWTAAIVAGLAVVLTGAIAYAAVEVQAEGARFQEGNAVLRELAKVNRRLAAIEDMLRKHVGETPLPSPEPKEDGEEVCAMKCKSAGDEAMMKKCMLSCRPLSQPSTAPMKKPETRRDGMSVCMKECLAVPDSTTNSGYKTEAACSEKCSVKK